MQERRQHIRVDQSLEITYRLLKRTPLFSSRSKELSEGGISLPTNQRLEPGIIIELELRLPDSKKPIKVTGEVVWRDKIQDRRFSFVIGVKFIKIDSGDRKKVCNYIRGRGDKGHVDWIE
jgi:c-di-GMP-binding flagellar brake protein YcgR